MGFPIWTLWGMGLSGTATLALIGLALLAQSPAALSRFGLGSVHLQKRIRAFTGYGFAFLLLAMGFFLAGVPTGESATSQTIVVVIATPTVTPPGDGLPTSTESETTTPESAPNSASDTPQTGAFGGPPPGEATPDETTTGATPDGEASGDAEASPTISPSPTPLSPTSTASPTPTATATPTQTPTPTITPTPIRGETAVLDLQGGTLWMQRTPGGQNLVILNDQEIVILQSGHANQAGVLWREVRTVDGVLGWVPAEWLRQ